MNYFVLKEQLKPFLTEDIQFEDLTSESIFGTTDIGSATIVAKADGVLAGTPVISAVYELLDTRFNINFYKKDGDILTEGDIVATVKGPIRTMLTGERIILNLLQRMSGIAT